MPLQNRVTPFSEIVAAPARGRFMGNRGILHDAAQHLGKARWRHPHWVTCVLDFKGWHREVMQPHNYTELFFLDEATALAAGHRPCALCRRQDYLAFQAALQRALHRKDRLDAASLDRLLHQARIVSGSRLQQRFDAVLSDVPQGCMVCLPGQPETAWLVMDDRLLRWQPTGYGKSASCPRDDVVQVLTPRPTTLALQNGYRPVLHPSAMR
jgi:hypothetical protein